MPLDYFHFPLRPARWVHFLVILVLGIVPLARAQTVGGFGSKAGPIPTGVFNLADVNVPAADAALANPLVDGISVRVAWRLLEPEKGKFDWAFLDSEVARAAKAGKVVLLRVLSEGPGKPLWLSRKDFQTFSYEDKNPYHQSKGKRGVLLLFWDKAYLAEKKRMIAEVGKRYGNNRTVRIVAAICASAHSGDWHVPHEPEDIANWKAVGYKSDLLIAACQEIMDTTMESFPNQYVTLAIGQNGALDPDPDYVARNLVQNTKKKYPGRLIVQKNTLSAKTDPPTQKEDNRYKLLWDSRPEVAGQMLWFSYGDPTSRNATRKGPTDPETSLRQSIAIGVSYGMKYIEIYEEDVLGLPSVIRYAHTALTK